MSPFDSAGASPDKEADFALRIRLPDAKKACAALILPYLALRIIPYRVMGKLIGRMSLSQTLLIGKFARA